MIKEQLKGKSPDYIEGFMSGVKLFAHWKDGIEYVGSCGKTYQSVLKEINELLTERAKMGIDTNYEQAMADQAR